MAKTALMVTRAVESHSTPMSNHSGRGLCMAAAGGSIQDSSFGSALRNVADARSIAAISRSNWSRSAAASELESFAFTCVKSRSYPTHEFGLRPQCLPRGWRGENPDDAATWGAPLLAWPFLADQRHPRIFIAG